MEPDVRTDILALAQQLEVGINLSIHTLHHSIVLNAGVHLFFIQDNNSHPIIQGNKFYKLAGHFLSCKQHGYKMIHAWGGPKSHLLTAAAACANTLQYEMHAFIRGRHREQSPEVEFMHTMGVQVHYLEQAKFDQLENNELAIHQEFPELKDAYHIPFGGSGKAALPGLEFLCKNIFQVIPAFPSELCYSVGSGTMAAGIIASMQNLDPLNKIKNLLFPAFQADFYSIQQMLEFRCKDMKVPLSNNWYLSDDFQNTRYAKPSRDLILFCESWNATMPIAIEPIYSGRMCFNILEMIQRGKFNKGTHIYMYHCGMGFPQKKP